MMVFSNSIVNDIMTGTEGEAWINGQKVMSIKKLSAKISGDFSEEKECGNYGNIFVYNGWKGDGSLVVNKKESFSLKLIGEQFLTGNIKPVKLISNITNKSNGKSERVALWVIFKEFDIINFEAKANMEEDIPFSICSYEILNTI